MVAAAKKIQDTLGAESPDPALRDLLELARDNSIPSRNRLVERLGDLYFEDSSVNAAERDLMAEILRDLVRDVEMAVRSKLAERLAADPNAPAGLVSVLANDKIEVAHPILMRSNALPLTPSEWGPSRGTRHAARPACTTGARGTGETLRPG